MLHLHGDHAALVPIAFRSVLTLEEVTAWLYGLVSLIAFVTCVAIVINIVATIASGVVTPPGRDQRDRDICRFEEEVDNSFVILDGIGAFRSGLSKW